MNAEDARAWGQALVASCARFLSHANNVVSTHVLHVRSPTFDATLRDGLRMSLSRVCLLVIKKIAQQD